MSNHHPLSAGMRRRAGETSNHSLKTVFSLRERGPIHGNEDFLDCFISPKKPALQDKRVSRPNGATGSVRADD